MIKSFLFDDNFFIKTYGVIFALGLLYPLAFPPINCFVIIFIVWIGATYIFRLANNFLQTIFMCLSLSLGVTFSGFYWIFYSSQYILSGWFLPFLVLLGFSVLYAIFFLPWAFLIFISNKHSKLIFVLATLIGLATTEVLKEYLFGGFPWLIAGQIWDFSLEILQIASIIGAFGLSILTILLFILFISIFIFKISLLPRILLLSIYCIGISSLWCYGYYRLNYANLLSNPKTISLSLVETSVLQNDKNDYNKTEEIFLNTLNQAFSNINLQQYPDYIILPEVAFNFFFDDNSTRWQTLVNQIPSKSKLIMGALRTDNMNVYNTAYMISGKTKQIVSYYDKIKLVPFGEYIPFANYLPFIQTFVNLSNLKAGDNQTIFIGNQDKFAIIICFEAIFSNAMLSYKNIDWLLNITNEGWFNNSIELDQMNSLLRMRSIEGGVTTVKVANLGKSVIINPLGNYEYLSNGYSSKYNLQIVDIQRVATYYSFTYKNMLVIITIMLYVIMVVMLTWFCKRK